MPTTTSRARMTSCRAVSSNVVLLAGATGTLGDAFISRYGPRYAIIGIARGRGNMGEPVPRLLNADLTRDVDAIVARALTKHPKIDALINNAVLSRWTPLTEQTTAGLLEQFETNVAAPLALSNALLQQCWMKCSPEENRERGRSIVNVSSIAGLRAYPGYHQGSYAATKAALNILTQHMADEFATFGIRVNAVAPDSFPGIVSTESVCDVVVDLIESNVTGRVEVIDAEGPNES